MDFNKLCIHCLRNVDNIDEIEKCPYCGKPVKTAPAVHHQLKPFTILAGKYLVGEVLGEGGFGITYVGFDLNLELRVAIKEFYPNGYATREANITSNLTVYEGRDKEYVEKWKSNFIKEARSLAKCAHLPGIVGVKDFFQENNTAYIVMEYLEGVTLKEHIKKVGGKIPAEQLISSIEPVIRSLQEIHERDLIHRDISPDNIMLLSDGSVKLLDFGAARDYSENEEKSLSVMLKPGYAPEEQYRTKGKQGPWSDVYALCATMYRCITGVAPIESMERLRKDELKKPSELGIVINPKIEQAILKGMAVYSEERYQSMEQLLTDLLACKDAYVPQTQKEQTVSAIESAECKEQKEKKNKENRAEVVVKQKDAIKKKAKKIITTIKDTVKNADNKTIIRALDILIVACVVIVIILKISSSMSVNKEENIEELEVASESSLEMSADERILEEFAIGEEVVTNYRSALDPYQYRQYRSEINKFYFSYPVNLYNSVAFDDNEEECDYGLNQETILFNGSDVSALQFSVYKRTDERTIDDMLGFVNTCETEKIMDATQLQYLSEDTYGKIVLTGYSESYEQLIYELLRVEEEYVFQMKIIFPSYENSEDKLQKDYITECMYRMCGFSGTAERVRVYHDYKEYWKEHL